MENLNAHDKNKVELMNAICKIVKRERFKQREIADLLDIKQPRVSDLISKKYERFSIDILMSYMETLGYAISFEYLDSEKGKPLKSTVAKVKVEYRSLFAH